MRQRNNFSQFPNARAEAYNYIHDYINTNKEIDYDDIRASRQR